MGRPKKVAPSVALNLSLDADNADKLKRALFSELEGKIPHGAQSKFINTVLRRHFRSQIARAAQLKHLEASESAEVKAKVDAALEEFLAPEA